jgi:hypothetical protein
MTPETKIRRHGYHLMSLASLGFVGIALFGLLLVAMPWLPDWHGWNVAGAEWKVAVGMDEGGRMILSLSSALWTVAYLVPLMALRRLGHRLYSNEALSRPVADAFRWLAHSLPLHALLRMAAGLLAGIAAEVGGAQEPSFTLDFSGGYVFLIACLCLYSVAHLMRLATDAAADARSIV